MRSEALPHCERIGDSDRARAEETLRLAAEGLGPWMGDRLGVWPSDKRGNVHPHDIAYLIEVILDRRGTFPELDTPAGRAAIYRLRDARNTWAHFAPLDEATVRSMSSDAATVMRLTGVAPRLEVVVSPHDRPRAASGHRRARAVEFRAQQWEQRFAAHCQPINLLVEELIAEKGGRWMPFVAPYHGGVEAMVLLLFQDPGRMTNQASGGSGFIGCENDDPSAETLAVCLDEAMVTQRQVLPWNAYPWYLPEQAGVSASQRVEGLEALHRLIKLLPSLHTVVSCGAVAHDSWRRFARAHSDVAANIRHLETFHTSGRGITNGGKQTKAKGVAHVVATLTRATTEHARVPSERP